MKQIVIILGAVILISAAGAWVYTSLPKNLESGVEIPVQNETEVASSPTSAPTPAPAPVPGPAGAPKVVPPSPVPAPAQTPAPAPSSSDEVVCAQDLQQCPDGSYVTRGGPKCEFATCPSSTKVSGLPVQIVMFQFSPGTVEVHKGTTVVWTNKDSAVHTVTGDAGGPASPSLAQGDSYSYTFDTLGSFPYHCALHPSMKGTVKVVE